MLLLFSFSNHQVSSVRAEEGDFLRASGFLEPVVELSKSTAINGKIADIFVTGGDEVESNELLLNLDDSRRQKEISSLEKSLAQEKKQLEAEEESYQQALLNYNLSQLQLDNLREKDFSLLETEIELAKAELEYETTEFNRAERLYSREAMEDVEFAQYEFNYIRSQLNKTIAELTLAEQRKETEDQIEEQKIQLKESESARKYAELQLEAAELAHEAAKLDLEQLKLELADYEFKAPKDMVVLDVLVEAGEQVTAGEELFTLASQDLQIVIEPDEREIGSIYQGQQGKAVVESYPEENFPVEVKEIAPKVDIDRGTIKVKLDITGETPDLLPFMTVSVDLELGEE